jgi:hypothetical protein
MTRTLIPVAAAVVAIATLAAPTSADARWRGHHHGFPVGPVVGGLAAGALLGAALAAPPYYGPYAYYEPAYVGPECYVRRERIWDGWHWRIRRVEECF